MLRSEEASSRASVPFHVPSAYEGLMTWSWGVCVQVQQLFLGSLSPVSNAKHAFDQLLLNVSGKPSLTAINSKHDFLLESGIWNFQRPQVIDLYQRFPFQGKLRQTSKGYKPQLIEIRIHGVVRGKRRVLLAAFVYDIVDHLQRWADVPTEDDHNTKSVELLVVDGVCQSSRLKIHIDNLQLLHARGTGNASIHIQRVHSRDVVVRQIELVDLKRLRRSARVSSRASRASGKHAETRVASLSNAELSSRLIQHKLSKHKENAEHEDEDKAALPTTINDSPVGIEAGGDTTSEFYVEVESYASSTNDTCVPSPVKMNQLFLEQQQLVQQLQLEVARLRAESEAKSLHIEHLLSSQRLMPSPIRRSLPSSWPQLAGDEAVAVPPEPRSPLDGQVFETLVAELREELDELFCGGTGSSTDDSKLLEESLTPTSGSTELSLTDAP